MQAVVVLVETLQVVLWVQAAVELAVIILHMLRQLQAQ
jgi:hypothetical protein